MNTVSKRHVDDTVRALLESGQKFTVTQLAERIGAGMTDFKHGQLKHQVTQALHRLRRRKLAKVKGLNWNRTT